MHVVQTMDMAESPLEFWARVHKDHGAWVRSLGARMAEAGAVGSLLRVGRPPADHGRRVRFDFEVRPRAGRGGVMVIRWSAHHARLEGELEIVPARPDGGTFRLSASYEPPWAAALSDRQTLQAMADEAARAFLQRLATSAARPAVPRPAEAPAIVAGPAPYRVLIEDEDPAWHQAVVQLCDGQEYEFASCRGPLLTAGGCPLLRGDACPKVEWAEIILHSLDHRQPANAALLDSLQRNWPGGSTTVIDGEPATYCLGRHWSGSG